MSFKYLNCRKALKKYHPISLDVSDALEWIEDEIEILKSLSTKSEYVIDYLDSFITTFDDEFKCYHIVHTYYEVKTITKYQIKSELTFKRIKTKGGNIGTKNRRQTNYMQSFKR